ncbi:MAG: cytochrome b N-terminal domain-containing protein [Candidatus Sericytochromatia bacterium]
MGNKLQDFLETQVYPSQIWQSVFRHGRPVNDRNRSLAVLSNVFLHLHPIRLPRYATKYTYTWGMGGISFLLFLVETVTGILLMFYYHPTDTLAYADIKSLEFDVPFGMLLRNMHRWGAHMMVLAVWFHMYRVFLTGSYKKPREFNWGVGVILLTITLFMSFTGYLLPWDQLAMWAITVGTNMARATPFLGHEGPFAEYLGMKNNNDVRFALLGGTVVGGPTLIRFYVLHCIAVPFVMSFLLSVHFWRIRKDGGISGPQSARLANLNKVTQVKAAQGKKVETATENKAEK